MSRENVLARARSLYAKHGLAAVRLDAVPGAEREFDSDVALRRELVREAIRQPFEARLSEIRAAPTGEAALGHFIEGVIQSSVEDLLSAPLHLFMTQPEALVLVGADDEHYGESVQVIADGVLTPLTEKLERDWGDDLPQGIHPRRLAWLTYCASIGAAGMMATARTFGGELRHKADDQIDELQRALSAPTAIMRQLAALNEVARELETIRDEATLRNRAPDLLERSLEIDVAYFFHKDDPEIPARYREVVEARKTLFATPEDGAFIAAPVLCQKEVYGVISGHVSPTGRRLDRRDVSRFETFAALLGLAFDNARWVSLIQSEKMAAMSKLVAGVAHELNTPLGALVSSADVSARALDRLAQAIEAGDSEKSARMLSVLRKNFQASEQAGARINERVQALKNFARLDEADRKTVDVHEGIDSTLLLLSHQMEGRAVDKRYGELEPIDCHPNELNQVFMNLVLNSISAGAKKLTITTTHEGESVSICLEDDGRGIEPEDLPRIFDPGFTKWTVGVGAGLGLSTCLQIMDRHRGRIEVDSTPGQGTRVRLSLPLRMA